MNLQNECHQFIQNIIGCSTDFTTEEVIEVLNDLLQTFNKNNEKKNYEMVKKYIEEIKFLKNDNIEIYRQNKEKILYSNIKLDNKTRYSNTVSDENLSPTMYAYYFCEKSRQILSDKESAALKAMSLENNFEMIEEENNLKFNRMKEVDQISNHSNNSKEQLSLYTSSFIDRNEKLDKCNFEKTEKIEKTENPQLGRKRKYSMKMTTNSTGKRTYKKVPRNSNRNNPFEDQNENNKDEEEELWCIPNCTFKSKNGKHLEMIEGANEWIGCDSCDNWYHPKCLNMPKEEFEYNRNQDLKWHCSNCKNHNKI